MSAQVFKNDDDAYRSWISANPAGLVVNTERVPVAHYLMLHKATCKWISSPDIKNFTTTSFIKVCSNSLDDLKSWGQQQTGGVLKPCGACRPLSAHPQGRSPATGRPTSAQGAPAQGGTPAPSGPPDFTLASGLPLYETEDRMLRFCQKEYAYYDGVADLEPDRVLPIDVMVTIAMNSYVSQADQVRTIHQGLARACDARLAAIPVDADLATFDPDGRIFADLMDAAVQVPRVLAAVATKVLHRKRRNYIPMLDGEILKYYLRATNRADWFDTKAQDKRTAGMVATEVWKSFRADLVTNLADLRALQTPLDAAGFPLTPVRILEILVWMSTEPRGYYRS